MRSGSPKRTAALSRACLIRRRRGALAGEQALHTVDSLEAMLAQPNVNAVVVATPNSMHLEHALAAIDAGKHVMVEKPMALDFAQAQQIVESAERRGVVLSVFHNRRFDLDYQTVEQAIRSETLGRVFNVESRLGQWGSCVGPAAREWRPNWRNESSFGGGGLYDWGSHFHRSALAIDSSGQAAAPFSPSFAATSGRASQAATISRVLIDFDSGATGLVEINTTTTRPLPRWHLDGTNGSAFSPFSPEYDNEVWASLRFTPADGSPSRTLPPAGPGLNKAQIWESFARACTATDPRPSARSVLGTMALLDAARRSSAEGCAVAISDSRSWTD